MAAWQFSIVLIPLTWAEKNRFNSAALYCKDEYQTNHTWQEYQPPEDYKQYFDQVLTAKDSWDEQLLVWGEETDHDIQVLLENAQIADIRIRISLTKPFSKQLSSTVNLTKLLGCALFFPESHQLIQANEFMLRRAINDSNAMKYVNKTNKIKSKMDNISYKQSNCPAD